MNRRKFLKYGLPSLAALGAGKGFYNTGPGQLEIDRIHIKLPGLPTAFDGFRIALLSDFHASFTANWALYERAAELVAGDSPDIVALAGDFVTSPLKLFSDVTGGFNEQNLNHLIDALEGIKAPSGIYGVLGNHDFWSGPEAVSAITGRFESRLGVKWLRNGHAGIERGGAAIDLLGVDDYWQKSCSLGRALAGLKTENVRILLSHNPDINGLITARMKIDLVLCGHTHGGQIVLPAIGSPAVPSKYGQKYRAGLVRDGRRLTYVTRGVGHVMIPARFNCPPEVTLITLDGAGATL